MDWEPKFYITSKLLRQSWCRIVAQYLDWASHIPELQELDERDQELLVVGRSIASCWILMGRKSVVTNTPGLTVSGGAFMPYDRSNEKPDSIVTLLGNIIDVMMNEFIIPMKELQVTDAEYTLLRVICFLMPIPKLSQDGITKINAAKNKYIDAFTQVILAASPNMPMPAILQRVSRLMLLIPVVEKVAQMVDDNFAMMALFNINEMNGTLTFDLHCRKNDPFIFSKFHTSPKSTPLYD
uniref:NR LBD domain-containing protein n=1 Tax=Acrobeloides nanus TaxID=290746 RepID=A0A914D7P8_9BILA